MTNMKALKYLSAVLTATVMFAACEKSDDDMPRLDLNASIAPVLSSLDCEISSALSEYTFYYNSGKFVVDGQEVVIAQKDQGQQYALQVDNVQDFSTPATVLKQNYDSLDKVTVTYEQICSAISSKQLASLFESWKGTLYFRILLLPGGQVSDGFPSNVITVSATIKYVDPDPKIYICNNAGWDELRLYAWGDDNSALGDWPGLEPESSIVELGGKTYYVFDVRKAKDGIGSLFEHFIVNNNDKGSQIDNIFEGNFADVLYITINADGSFTIDNAEESAPEQIEPEPIDNTAQPENVTATVSGSKIVVETDKDIVLYVWAWNDTENQGQLTEAGWPGDKFVLTSSTDSKFTYEYDFANAVAIPESFIISTDNDVKFFDGVVFTDGEKYEWIKSEQPEPVEPEPVEPEALENLTFTFKTATEGDYYVWAWGGDFGGDAFSVSGAWPGDKLELVSTENGEYIYGYTFTKTPGIPPTNIIISTNGGGKKLYDGAEFVKGKEY